MLDIVEIIGIVKWEMERAMLQAMFLEKNEYIKRAIEMKIAADTKRLSDHGIKAITVLCNDWNNPEVDANTLETTDLVVETIFENETHYWKIHGAILNNADGSRIQFSVTDGEIEEP